MLSADILWAVSLTPVALVAVTLTVYLVGAFTLTHRRQVETLERRRGDADLAAYWSVMHNAQAARAPRVGTAETPEPERISLLQATLPEALEYLRQVKARHEAGHREFLALMGV